jgi:hypothetical protein
MIFFAFIVCFSLFEQMLMIVLVLRDIPHVAAATQGGGADAVLYRVRTHQACQLDPHQSIRIGHANM